MPVHGINIDPDNPNGLPKPPNGGNRFQELEGLKWARIVFQATPHQPRTIQESCDFYNQIVDQLSDVGIRTLFILGHQTFIGNVPWSSQGGDWNRYAQDFSGVCGEIASQFRGKRVAYEIWNEGDQGSDSAHFVDPATFAPVLQACFNSIKANDPNATVVFGGLVSGDPVGYLRVVRDTLGGQMPVDAIGIHPYGKGPHGDNSIIVHLSRVANTFPDHPIWVTEIGDGAILDVGSHYDDLVFYIREINRVLRDQLRRRVPVFIWYCWSDGMNKHFGIVDEGLNPKGRVYDAYFEVARANAAPDAAVGAVPPPAAAPVPSTFTHQELINAIFKANTARGGNVWDWFKAAGLNHLFDDRDAIYNGTPIDDLPGLTQDQKDLIKQALAKQPLPLDIPNPPIQPTVLEIDWISQMDATGHGNNDCGDASVLMLLHYYGLATPSREDVFNRFAGKTTPNNLITLAGEFGLPLIAHSNANNVLLQALRNRIDEQKPVIALVNYADLGFPVHLQSGVDQGLHWLVVVGYVDDIFYIHDPLWLPSQRDGKGGGFLTIQSDDLEMGLRRTILHK